MPPFLSALLTAVVLAPIVYISVVLYREGLTVVGLILDAVVLLAGTAFIYLSWRCPHCWRPFAGTLVDTSRSNVSDTATVRDTSGISRTVTTSRVRTTRTYRCRHCGETFYRG